MIYAPPSREKSKQTVRSPVIEKPNDEYHMNGATSTVFSGQGAITSNVGGANS